MTKLEKTVGVLNILNIIPWAAISTLILWAFSLVLGASIARNEFSIEGYCGPVTGVVLAVTPLIVFIRRAISIFRTKQLKTAHATSWWAISCAIVGTVFWFFFACKVVPGMREVIINSFYGYPYDGCGFFDNFLPVGVALAVIAPVLLVPYYAILTYLRIRNRRAAKSVE